MLAKIARLDGSDRVSRTRRRIHDAAQRTFSEKGLAAQIDDIVRVAGVSRGTFYNYYRTVDQLFSVVAAELAEDLGHRVYAQGAGIADPAQRIANGIRYFCHHAHANRDWGHFLANFGLSTETLLRAIRDTAFRDLSEGIASGRFRVRPDQAEIALTVISGAVLGSFRLILAGIETPGRVGESTAEMAMRALGIDDDEASALSQAALPPLSNETVWVNKFPAPIAADRL